MRIQTGRYFGEHAFPAFTYIGYSVALVSRHSLLLKLPPMGNVSFHSAYSEVTREQKTTLVYFM